MEENILKFGKALFVSLKKDNINQYYEVIAKVVRSPFRNLAREPSESSIKADSGVTRDHGGPSKRYKRHRSRISTC